MLVKLFPLNPEDNIFSFTFYFSPNKACPVFVSSCRTFVFSISCVVTIMTSSTFTAHSVWKKQQYRKWKGLSRYVFLHSPIPFETRRVEGLLIRENAKTDHIRFMDFNFVVLRTYSYFRFIYSVTYTQSVTFLIHFVSTFSSSCNGLVHGSWYCW
jgi:hypothetical protein